MICFNLRKLQANFCLAAKTCNSAPTFSEYTMQKTGKQCNMTAAKTFHEMMLNKT